MLGTRNDIAFCAVWRKRAAFFSDTLHGLDIAYLLKPHFWI